MLVLAVVRLRLLLLFGQSLPVLAHLRRPALLAGVSSARGDAWNIKWLISGRFKAPSGRCACSYRCHNLALGSASGVVFSTRVVVLPKKADGSSRCEEVVGHDGEELLARFRLWFGVSSVDELLGIQPMCSSGDCSGRAGFFTSSSKVPIRSSSGSLVPGVHGKVFA